MTFKGPFQPKLFYDSQGRRGGDGVLFVREGFANKADILLGVCYRPPN